MINLIAAKSIFNSFEIISLWLWGVFTKNINIEWNCEKTI